MSEAAVWQDIMSQPGAWRLIWRRLGDLREGLSRQLAEPWDAVLFTGCGSTHYLSLAAANLYQQLTGRPARGLPSSEVALFPAGVYPAIAGRRILLVAVSRSGETSETLWAVAEQQRRRLPVLAVTCRGGSALAAQSEMVLALEEGYEASVAQTRSFTSMYLATQFLAGLAAGNGAFLSALEQLPELGQTLIDRNSALLADLGRRPWARIIVLGSGPYYGLACEGMLKLKEMALLASEAYHFLEFRHGPISLVDEKTLVVGLLSDTAAATEQAVLDDVRKLGGQTLAIGAGLAGSAAPAHILHLDRGLPELARGALCLVPVQMLAYHQTRTRGLDPDAPRHLRPAIVLGGEAG